MSQVHTLMRGLRRYRVGDYSSSAQPTHATAATWAARVVSNGGAAVSNSTLVAVSNFCYALDSAGLLSQMLSVNCYVPDNLIAAITPLVTPGGVSIWTNHSFVLADLSVGGLKGDGSTKWLDTGVAPSSVFASATSAGLSLYCATTGGGTEADFGACHTSGSPALVFYSSYSNLAIMYVWTNLTGGQLNTSNVTANGAGFYSVGRSGATLYIYKAVSGSLTSLATGSGTAVLAAPTFNISAHAQNSQSGINAWSTKRISFAAIHPGLSFANAGALYSAVQALRVALGGGYL